MVRRWEKWKNPWDREYAMRGRLWRGQASIDPLPTLVPPPARVLEVGCGDGKFLRALTAAGYEWTGLDASRRAVALAREAGPGALMVADARRLPFASKSFSVVVARYLLGALDEAGIERAVSELVRVVAKDGFVVVEDFSTADFRYGTGKALGPRTFERNHGITSRYFEPGELSRLFALPGVERERRHALRVRGKSVPRVSWQFVGRKP